MPTLKLLVLIIFLFSCSLAKRKYVQINKLITSHSELHQSLAAAIADFIREFERKYNSYMEIYLLGYENHQVDILDYMAQQQKNGEFSVEMKAFNQPKQCKVLSHSAVILASSRTFLVDFYKKIQRYSMFVKVSTSNELIRR